MYAVVFKATVKQLDEQYSTVVSQLRERAHDYGCKEFTSVCDGDNGGDMELTVSYWETLEQIKVWKEHPLHLSAQALGKKRWYSSYQVRVVEVLREYAK